MFMRFEETAHQLARNFDSVSSEHIPPISIPRIGDHRSYDKYKKASEEIQR